MKINHEIVINRGREEVWKVFDIYLSRITLETGRTADERDDQEASD